MPLLIVERFRLLLAKALMMCDEPDDACSVYLGIAKRLAGKPCVEYGIALKGAGSILYQRGEREAGVECYHRAVDFYEQLPPFPEKDLHLALLYEELGIISRLEHQFSQMRDYDDRAMELLSRLDPSLASKHLSGLYNSRMVAFAEDSNLDGFVESFVKAVQYKDYAEQTIYRDMNTLLEENLNAIMNRSIGRPNEILRLLNTLLACPEVNDTMRGIIFENGSLFFTKVGHCDRALEYARRQLDCCTRTYGAQSLQAAKAYIRAADCCYDIEPDSEYWQTAEEDAHTYGYAALHILQDHFPENSEMIADASYCLACILIKSGRYDDALRYLRQSVDKIRLTKGSDHPAVYSKLTLHIMIYIKQGKLLKALEYAKHILEVVKKQPHADCFEQLNCYIGVIFLKLACGMDHAVEYVGELMDLWPQVLDAILVIPQEDLRLSCIREVKDTIGLFFSTAFAYPQAFDQGALYEITLKTNHIDNELNYIYAQYAQGLHNTELERARKQVLELEKSAEWLTVEGKRGTQEYADIASQLEAARGDELRALGGSQAGGVFDRLQLADIQRALGENEIILEYARFSQITPGQGAQTHGVNHYCAFAVTKTCVELLLLGDCKEIDDLVNGLVAEIEAGGCADERLASAAGILLAPFQARLAKASTIYIVPDGVLYRLPFELLTDCVQPGAHPAPCSVIYLSSGRELLRTSLAPRKDKIRILANPQYNLDRESMTSGGAVESPGTHGVDREELPPDPDQLPPLQFSEGEARRIAALFDKDGATVITGRQASKAALRPEPDTDILHISTHGFAYQWESRDSSPMEAFSPDRSKYLTQVQDPLLRCGLFFAGASNWLRDENPPAPYEDGILLGRDLAVMDLSQYRLAVLAACQTACGDLRAGEGLKGLRHAFELAGVGCLICALWAVDDFASALMMDRFYKELLADGTLPSDALTKAKRYVKNVTAGELVQAGWDEYLNEDVIDRLIEEGQGDYANRLQDILDNPDMHPFSHPRYWAGFIIQGRCE